MTHRVTQKKISLADGAGLIFLCSKLKLLLGGQGLLEVLVVLQRAPGATPGEAVLAEETVAEVMAGNLIGKTLVAVDIGAPGGGLDEQRAVPLPAHAGVVEGVDIDGEATGMVRQARAALDGTVAVARGVVGLHGTLVVVAVVGDGTDALYGVALTVELGEDLPQVVADGAVADDDALMRLSVEAYVPDGEGVELDACGLGCCRLCQENEQREDVEWCHGRVTFFLSLVMAFSRRSEGSMML